MNFMSLTYRCERHQIVYIASSFIDYTYLNCYPLVAVYFALFSSSFCKIHEAYDKNVTFCFVSGNAADEPTNEPATGRHGHARPYRGLPATLVLVRTRPWNGKLVLS